MFHVKHAKRDLPTRKIRNAAWVGKSALRPSAVEISAAGLWTASPQNSLNRKRHGAVPIPEEADDAADRGMIGVVR
jgi:hypothetical protein